MHNDSELCTKFLSSLNASIIENKIDGLYVCYGNLKTEEYAVASNCYFIEVFDICIETNILDPLQKVEKIARCMQDYYVQVNYSNLPH